MTRIPGAVEPNFYIIDTKGSKAARYDGPVQILICPLFFKNMMVRKDAREFSLRNDACFYATLFMLKTVIEKL